jgi:hypothetical protein
MTAAIWKNDSSFKSLCTSTACDPQRTCAMLCSNTLSKEMLDCDRLARTTGLTTRQFLSSGGIDGCSVNGLVLSAASCYPKDWRILSSNLGSPQPLIPSHNLKDRTLIRSGGCFSPEVQNDTEPLLPCSPAHETGALPSKCFQNRCGLDVLTCRSDCGVPWLVRVRNSNPRMAGLVSSVHSKPTQWVIC